MNDENEGRNGSEDHQQCCTYLTSRWLWNRCRTERCGCFRYAMRKLPRKRRCRQTERSKDVPWHARSEDSDRGHDGCLSIRDDRSWRRSQKIRASVPADGTDYKPGGRCRRAPEDAREEIKRAWPKPCPIMHLDGYCCCRLAGGM